MHRTFFLAAFIASGASGAMGASVASYDNGQYNRTGINAGHTPDNPSIVTGKRREGPNITRFHSFTLFDLSSLAGETVTAATLTFAAGNGIYESPDASETVAFWDVTSDLDDLVLQKGSASPNVSSNWADLSGGTLYGTATVAGTDGDPMPEVSAMLNADAVAAINAVLASSDQRFGIGAGLTTFDLASQEEERLWVAGSSSAFLPAATLDLTVAGMAPVPLPASLPLLIAALGGVVALRRRA